LTQEEFIKIEEKLILQISEESAQKECSLEQIEETKQIGKILNNCQALELAHQMYHLLELQYSCREASDSNCIKFFIAGYKCRLAIEQEKELAQLVSGPNS
jgi:hypothetical protein